MPANLEIKVSYKNLGKLQDGLKAIGAKFIVVLAQKDTYYKTDKGLLKLRIDGDKTELIYYNRNEKNAKRWSEYYTLQISDSKPEQFFSRLYKVEVVVKKNRKLYMYKNTRIHLDTVQGLGTFVELESMVKTTRKAAENEFKFVMENLHLPVEKELRMSYRDLLMAKRGIQ
jgi:predicted adenylyl cyclase CyaB